MIRRALTHLTHAAAAWLERHDTALADRWNAGEEE